MAIAGSWVWFTNPRVYYSSDHQSLYTGWVSLLGDIIVRQMNAVNGYDTVYAARAAFEIDDHDSPSFLELSDGRIVVFYGKHADTVMRYRVTDTTGDLFTMGPEQNATLPVGNSQPWNYNCPFRMDSASYLLNLMQQQDPGWPTTSWWLLYNADNLASNTWSSIHAWTGAYIQVCGNGTDRVDFLMTNSHPQHDICSAYHMVLKWNGSAFTWLNSSLSALTGSPPYSPSSGGVTLVLDGSTVGNLWINQITYDSGGAPVALLTTYPSNSTTDGRYRFARWNGSTWNTADICDGGSPLEVAENRYTPGCCFDGTDTTKVYVAISDVSGNRVEKWGTSDNGATWSMLSTVSANDAVNKQWRPYSAANYPLWAPTVFWWKGTYTTYQNFAGQLQPAVSITQPPAHYVGDRRKGLIRA